MPSTGAVSFAQDGAHDPSETRQKEKVLKRARGELSCTECRRLKIRCDKKVPCSSCVRRGCSEICPNGSTSGTTTGINQLLSDLDKAQKRVRQLEDALRTSHERQASALHTLLVENGSRSIVASGSTTPGSPSIGPEHDPLEMFGTLTIADGGDSRFLGVSAASESFLISEITPIDNADIPPEVPSSLLQLGCMWPFSPTHYPRVELQELIESHLPSYERASSLCEAFLQNLAWFIQPISRAQIMEELLPVIYKRRRIVSEGNKTAKIDTRDLALLLAVFACGAAGDLTQEPSNMEGQKYKCLARSALGLSSILTRASLSSVQTMILLGLYNIYAARDENQEEAWKILSLAMGTAMSVSIAMLLGSLPTYTIRETQLGLHRDPGRWQLPMNVQERRRYVFWEAYGLECSAALSSGRPPAIPFKAVDVKYPQGVQPMTTVNGLTRGGNDRFWKYEFLRRCLVPVAERFCADATPVKYCEVVEFDQKISEFENEKNEKDPTIEDEQPFNDSVHAMMGQLVNAHCETLRVRIHLNFFARAILDNPDNPLRSPFSQSFQATFRAAMAILRQNKVHIETDLPLMLRIWPFWSHNFISAIVVGSVAFRCPTFSLARHSFAALEFAISSFQKGEHHPVVVKGLPILLKLREKAQRALFQPQTSYLGPSGISSTLDPNNSNGEDGDDELAILQGASRVVAQKGGATKTSPLPASSLPSHQEKHMRSPSYINPATAVNDLDLDPSNVHPFQTALNTWTMDIDALMAEELDEEHVLSPSVETAIEDGSFASLGVESFLVPPPNAQADGLPVPYTNVAFDALYSGGNAMQNSVSFFGDWNF